ncbi:DNA polymerase eta [Tribolium castaneum]|uniref:DNA polymerase eta n=1 Tax=Tribolium castaneum TaxID=7070 RepID=D6W6E6_TRICA|nr:PREDICTED: DNA polymerase eta [Tribolium castaneum]EFA11358.1 DNA polymerase eta-like Protein [Tribolium castaneum]|eukprot:XP_971192.1 PREDICTED: DNA polymerase eta [Tribolium castaneum]
MGPTDRVVVLVDMDCFYCQVEEKLNPALEGKPIAVVQYNAWQGGGIIAVNYPARDEGVTRHMRGFEAKKKCPSINLVQVPELRGKADLTKYRDAGKRVADVLLTFTPLLQRASVDEAYLDITEIVEKRIEKGLDDLTLINLSNTFVVGCELEDFLHNAITNKEYSIPNLKLAVGGLVTEEIRREVFKVTGYKCSAGIAHNKILAKLVCSLHKPNKQTILPQEEVEKFFETTPINKVKNLGGKFGQTLSEDFHVTTMGQLAKIPEKLLVQKYDEKTGNWLHNIARGIDMEPVTTKLIAKSIACCKNFPGKTALVTEENVQHWLGKLAAEMSERLDKDLKENNRRAKQIIVSFAQEVNKKDVHSTRTHPLVSYNEQKIAQAAFEVVKRFCRKSDGTYHLKFLGLNASSFDDIKNVRQITSFFQVGPNQPKKSLEKKPEVGEQSVYDQPTQELEEDSSNLIFYDDSYRVRDNNENELESTECSNIENVEELDRPTSSFFVKFFDNDSNENEQEEQDNIEENNDSEMSVEEETELCSECKKRIPISELMSHQDYHFALNLSRSENVPPNSNVKTPPVVKKSLDSMKKTRKRKEIDCGNNSIRTFFAKQEEPTGPTETCTECNRKIKVEEMTSHMDYHTAKKIHLELNAIKTVKPVTKQSKAKSGKTKNQSANKSVVSFFKPLG